MTEIEIADVVDDGSEKLESKYVRVRDAVRWESNPKRHDEPGLIDSINKYGFRDAPIWDATLGAIAGGNGRTHALLTMFDRGEDVPRGILLDKNGNVAEGTTSNIFIVENGRLFTAPEDIHGRSNDSNRCQMTTIRS